MKRYMYTRLSVVKDGLEVELGSRPVAAEPVLMRLIEPHLFLMADWA